MPLWLPACERLTVMLSLCVVWFQPVVRRLPRFRRNLHRAAGTVVGPRPTAEVDG
jgi:hypothetical protein